MKDSKKLLLAQLTDLHATMMEVHNRSQKLNMNWWITELSGSKEDHWCGTVACWCGWQSLGNLDNFPTAKDWKEVAVYQGGIARRVSDDLDSACCEVFGNSQLVGSIYEGQSLHRQIYAESSELFNAYELNHQHLRSENPTALEAANYISLCIEKVKSHEH